MDLEELKRLIKRRRVLLFAGAGTSIPLGLPSWTTLIKDMGKALGYDPDIFLASGQGDYLALSEFFKKKGRFGEFISELNIAWHSNIKIEKSKIHQKIIELDFPIIYTTNYDNWFENAYDHYEKKYTKIVNVRDIAESATGNTQIVKFHGDFSDHDSLVLTETSYFERLSFECPLDIKLRSDILGHSILFVGYSFGDSNIKHIWHKLSKIWEAKDISEFKPKSYIFLKNATEIQEFILNDRGIQVLSNEIHDHGEALLDFLNSLQE